MTLIFRSFGECLEDKSDEVAIEAAVRDMGRMEEAKKRYLSGGEG